MKAIRLVPVVLALGLFAPAASDAEVLDVVTGANYTCALISDGTVRCFGDNSYGNLGTPDGVSTNTPHPVPVIAPLPRPAIKVVAGYAHTCALLNDRTVSCWGFNHVGQTGSSEGAGVYGGFGSPPGLHANPVLASFPAGVEDLAAGDYHTCAVLAGGPIACVGANDYGQMGNTTDNDNHGAMFSGPPPHVNPLATTTAWDAAGVFAAGSQTCIILKNTDTRCFGANFYGQLGNAFGVNTNNSGPVPTKVNFGVGNAATQVGMGYQATCAIITGNVAKCWGDNRYGKLGNNINDDTNAAHDVPATVTLPAGAKQIDIDYWHACAVLVTAEVYCWGNNHYGELGNETDLGIEKSHPTPALVTLAGPAKKVVTGGAHTCAVLVNGTLQCWGNSSYGQAGTTVTGSPTPTTIGGLDPIVLPTPSGKKLTTFRKPKFKRKVKGKKLVITGTITPIASGLLAADCTGRVALTFKVKKKRIAAKKFSLKFTKGACSAKVNWKIAKKHKGKKTRLTLSLIGSTTLTAPSRTVSIKL